MLVAACGGSPSGGPSASGDSPSTALQSTAPSASVSTSPAAGSSPTDVADVEAADRLAVEQAWATYWTVHQELLDLPADEWPAAVDEVAVDPTRAQVLSEAELFTKSGLRFYGQVVSHPYWSRPIDGKDTAVMGDCGDYSDYGTVYVESGHKRSVGVEDNNTRVTLIRGDDGTWRVQKIEYLLDVAC